MKQKKSIQMILTVRLNHGCFNPKALWIFRDIVFFKELEVLI